MSISKLAVGLALALFALGVGAQQQETDAVTAANQAFYAALSARDIGTMGKVWSHADVQNIGPRSRAVDVGWDAVRNSLEGTFATFQELKVSMDQAHVKVSGSTAWVSGIEKAQRKDKAGQSSSGANLATNIYVKEGGRWLMVHHHASPVPQ